MSEPPTPVEEATETVAKVAKSSVLPKIILVVCAVLALLIAGVALTARYGVLLPQGRLLIETRTSGLKIGRFGRLHIEGLGGDVALPRHFGRHGFGGGLLGLQDVSLQRRLPD